MASGDATNRGQLVWTAFETHAPAVYRYVHRRCGDASIAEEITQDTFVAALESWDGSGAVPVEWLYRVARNRLIDRIRRSDVLESKLRLVGSDEPAVDLSAQAVERLRVEVVLAGLSSLHRSVLVLRYVDQLSGRELAEAFGRSERAIEALLMRARAALRAEMEANDD